MFEFAVKRPVAVTVIILSLLGLGIYFGNMVNVEFFPKLDIPIVSITTVYPGAGPEEVEEQVTKPLEESLGTVGNLKKISSTSRESISMVILEFEYGTNMSETVADVREKIDEVKLRLPEDARPPVVVKADPAASPVIRLTLSGTVDMRTLRTIADDDIKKELERIQGVAFANVTGGYEREILVAVDARKLEKYNFTPQGILQTLQMENINIPGGRITTQDLEFQVRTVGQFKTVDEILDIYVGKAGSRKLYLRDVAEVTDTHKEQRSVSRVDGVSCVTLSVRRNTDANVVNVCEKIRYAAPEIQKLLPPGSKLEIIYDESDFIKKSIHAMRETAVEGAMLAILVIFIFLGSLRSTLVVSLSIPTSVIATFIMLYFGNISINLITLAAFILAIGRVVDDSIVVLENIFRYVEEGKKPFEAAVEGAKEVGLAVMASTFTTMSVFFPLLIVGGLVGQFFNPLAKTYMTALFLSLVIAVLLIPMMAARLIKMRNNNEQKGFWANLFERWNRVWQGVENLYRGLLSWSLKFRFLVVLIAFGLFVMSLAIFARVPKEMSAKIDRGRTVISIESPVGSSVYRTDRIVREVEKVIEKEVLEREHLIADSGTSPSGQQSMSALGTGSEEPQKGGVSLYLVDKRMRKRSVFTIEALLRSVLNEIPGAAIRIEQAMSLSGEASLQIIIKGDDLSRLAELGEKYKKIIERIPGTADIDLNWRSGNPEYRIIIDRVKAAQLGVNLAQVASTIRAYVKGEEVNDISRFKEKGKEYDISVRLPEEERNSAAKLEDIPVSIDKDLQIPLWSIAEINLEGAPTKVTRQDRSRCVIVQGNVSGRAVQFVLEDIAKVMKENPPPSGFTWEIGGEETRRSESFQKLFTSLFLAIFLVYAILAIQFESFIHPLTIMLAIPLEMVGVSLALLVTGEPVSMVILLGLIMLTGIVVSNSILLVNYIIVLRETNMERRDAILRAGPVRLRPIVMTASATIIAMIPLALGLREGGEFFAPLAKVVIGGLITSTAFTLLVVPVAYTIIDDIGRFLGLAKK